MADNTPAQTLQQARELHQAGRLADAERLYRALLARDPQNPDALHMLGVLACQTNHAVEGVQLIRQSIALAPNDAEAHFNLGFALVAQRQVDEAIVHFRRAIELQPNHAGARNNLGVALKDLRRPQEAEECFRRSLQINPEQPTAWDNLGILLFLKGALAEAIAAFESALALNPGALAPTRRLASALTACGKLNEALEAYQSAAQRHPNDARAAGDFAAALAHVGRMDEAIAASRHAIALDPTLAANRGALIFAMHTHAGSDAGAIRAEQRRWWEQHGKPLVKNVIHRNPRDPEKRLRVGYVASEFYQHVSSFNLLPLLHHHNHTKFEIFCYANIVRPDSVTDAFKKSADQWRNITRQSDESAAAQVHQDGIDILVDLSLHLADNRLPIFARQPAPVQVTFAGYPASTGVETIQYRLTDPYLEPPGRDDHFWSEAPFRLPHSFWCYAPHGDEPPVNELPALSNAHFTFGCLSAFRKVNEPVLKLWARVLRAVPGSRLLMLLGPSVRRNWVTELLAVELIEASRIEFLPTALRVEYLQHYHRLDLGLDTFPYNGHTTSLDAMWMGVPTVTLEGSMSVGRAGVSQLSNVGLTELIAKDQDQFVEIASGLARDLPRLAELRSTLRPRMQASPLCDQVGFARDIEAAYRTMWRTWCLTPSPR